MAGNSEIVGILGLQGAIEPHERMCASLGVRTSRITRPEQLSDIGRIILPGGESSTMLKLLDSTGLFQPIIEFSRTRPIWGICAGAILIAKRVEQPNQRSMQLIDLKAIRNFYGSQRESFKAMVSLPLLDKEMEVDFIRAPRLEPLSDQVRVHASLDGNAVFCQQQRVIATSFHTELGSDPSLHKYFIEGL